MSEIGRSLVDLRVRDGLAYLGDSAHGLRIIDVSAPKQSAFVSSAGGFGDMWNPSAIALSERKAFVSSSTGGIRVVDLDDAKAPVVESMFRVSRLFGDSVRDIAVYDGVLYAAADESGLVIVDVSVPSVAKVLGRFDVGRSTYGIELYNSVAYLCNIETGLWAVDVSDPTQPVLLDRYAENIGARYATAIGQYLLVPEHAPSRLNILDISNPSNIYNVGGIELPTGFGKPVHADGFAYLPAGEHEAIYIVDVREPQKPVYVGSIQETKRPYELAVLDGDLFVADYLSGLRIYNIKNPYEPEQIGIYGPSRSPISVRLIDDFAVLVDNNFGIEIVHVSENCFPCPADANHDGQLTPADFSAWIAAYNVNQPECDQNDDGLCTPADFSAWIANYNAGC